MPDSQGFKLTLAHVFNVLYAVAIAIVLLTAYWVISSIRDFLFPPPKVTKFENVELINSQINDTLITSRAHIDAYLILEKLGNNNYATHDSQLVDIQSSEYKLKDKQGSKNRQLCVYSVEVSFGYDSWQAAVKAVKADTVEEGWPRITGIYPKRRLSTPETVDVASACRKAFSGAMEDYVQNAVIIRHWLKQDGVYRSHVEQGINQLVDIALWETGLDCKAAGSCEAENNKIMAWRDFQLNAAIDPILEAQDPGGGRDGTPGAGRNLPVLQASPIRGVYKETYSAMVFVNAQGRISFIPFTKDNELAVQRDVIEVTYGSTVYFRDAVTIGGQTTIYASLPDVVMKSLSRSEYALFARGNLDELHKAVGMSVSDYLQSKTNEMMAAAVAENRRRAVETSKSVLKQKLSMLNTVTLQGGTRESKPMEVKYTDVAPDEVGFSDKNLGDFLRRFQ